jgi:ATP-dependent DNA helicase RecG
VWEANGFVTTIFRPKPEVRAAAEARGRPASAGQVAGQVPDKYPTSTRQVLTALAKARGPLSRTALQQASGLRNREHFVNEHLKPMLAAGLIEPTIPEKPRSSKQRYRLTEVGRALVKKSRSGK